MSQYLGVLFSFAVAAFIVGVLVSLNRIIGSRPALSTAAKGEAFECGSPPTGTAWARFSVKFYLVAILFIVFDVEVVFMYPWAVVYKEVGLVALLDMGVFLAILFLGLIYGWSQGALRRQ